jgi:hypothetical protein
MTLSHVLLMLLSIRTAQVGRYGDPGDRLAGGTPACARRLPRAEYQSKQPLMCAHRTLPCGTPVLLLVPGGKVCSAPGKCSEVKARSAVCYVLDRGPYTKLSTGKYRSEFDLSPGAAQAINLSLYTGRMRLLYVALR